MTIGGETKEDVNRAREKFLKKAAPSKIEQKVSEINQRALFYTINCTIVEKLS